jgi:NAD(P)-dependent dehydrogenase (short-subunit alcohol dehydrogenase family)
VDIRDLSGKTVLVTGAASGIGQASATAFGSRGADLVICDVDEAGLAQTEETLKALGRSVLCRRVDVANPEEMCAFAQEVHGQMRAVDILMNNAGVGLAASFLDTSLEDWDWLLRINLRGVIHGCHFFVPPMVSRGVGGHVVNVSSMAGYLPSEALSAYTTSKYGVLGLSESLRGELHRHRIGVTAACPGVINTAITANSRMRGAADAPGERERMAQIFQRRNYGPERVARNVLKAIQRNRAVAPISPEAWILYYLKRIAPGAVRTLTRRALAVTPRDPAGNG